MLIIVTSFSKLDQVIWFDESYLHRDGRPFKRCPECVTLATDDVYLIAQFLFAVVLRPVD